MTHYTGPAALQQAIVANVARPLTLVSADFDEDGVPDLVVGYGTPAALTLYRGNVDAIYSHSLGAQRRSTDGTFSDTPFLSPARTFALSVIPDFLGAGDFDNDGHQDVVAAARQGTSLTLLLGDGGGFGAPETIPLPGKVTALAVGDVNRRDGLVDVVVGVEDGPGGQVLVFEGPEGALRAEPVLAAVPAPVTDLALTRVGADGPVDVVGAAGQGVVVVHGWEGSAPAQVNVEQVLLPFDVAALAVGNFVPRQAEESRERLRPQLALLAGDGTLHVKDTTSLRELVQHDDLSLHPAEGGGVRLVGARISSHGTDDLLLVDPAAGPACVLHAFTASSEGMMSVALEGDVEPVAILPMRLNADALDDLVVLPAGGGVPIVMRTQAATTFVVNSTAQEVDDDPGDGLCRDRLGRCTLHAAIQEANAFPGADEIHFDLGSGVPTLEWRMDYPDIVETLTILGDTGGATRVSLGDGGLISKAPNSTFRALESRQGIALIYGYGDQGELLAANDNVIEGCHLGPWDEYRFGLIYVNGTAGHQIGGTTEQARNVIVGNTSSSSANAGISVRGCAHNLCRIEGNYVGLEEDGTTPHGNSGVGIELFLNYGYNDILIGGTTEQARNVIAAHVETPLGAKGIGIDVRGDPQYRGTISVLIHGNYIGTNAWGNLGPGNAGHGIAIIDDVWNVSVGGTAMGAGNLIAGNGGDGVYLRNTVRDPIRGNSIYGNGGLGIDLDGDGPTTNDANDWDFGANRLQNWPEISSLTYYIGN